jgi:predicted metal-dependent HD superfamily phosphohydrolase
VNTPHATDIADLFGRFVTRCTTRNATDAVVRKLITHLRLHYQQPQRHYHTLEHVAESLTWLRWWQAGPPTKGHCALELAIWYHDIVYDPQAGDNESRSAAVARAAATRLGWHDHLASHVARLIESTAIWASRHQERETPLAPVIHDIDYAILGAPARRYRRYCADIRAEYSYLSDHAFADARGRFLTNLLSQTTVFRVPRFEAELEEQARTNLRGELVALRQ